MLLGFPRIGAPAGIFANPGASFDWPSATPENDHAAIRIAARKAAFHWRMASLPKPLGAVTMAERATTHNPMPMALNSLAPKARAAEGGASAASAQGFLARSGPSRFLYG